jgi:hypothetical protein
MKTICGNHEKEAGNARMCDDISDDVGAVGGGLSCLCGVGGVLYW